MKKVILLILIISASRSDVQSQITKGYWLIGGEASYSSLKEKVQGISSSSQIQIQLSGTVGYFFVDKFVGGFKPVFARDKVVNIYSSTSTDLYGLGPFLRYYFLPEDSRLNIFPEVSYQYGITYSTGNPVLHSNNFSGLMGCEWFLNQSVGLEFTIGYSSLKYTKPTETTNTIIAGIGFQFHLEREK